MEEENRNPDKPPRESPGEGGAEPASRGEGSPPPVSDRGGGLSRGRQWGFRIAGMTLVPLAFFLLLEGLLALFGFGYDTDYFVPMEGHEAYGSNMRFTWRFFPRALTRPPLAMHLPKDKPEGGFRVFILGGSAAQGDPSPAYGFSRILQVMLEEEYPGVEFEFFNTAITAINSHVVRVIADECAGMDPDLFIVYMGNNEVVGPYGPGTVFLGFSPSLSAIRAGIWAKSTRTGQLLERAVQLVKSKKEAFTEWRGMGMFVEHRVAHHDPRLEAVYGNFRSNLESILDAARRASAKTIVSTVAVNLRECAPFTSMNRSDLTPQEKTEWSALWEKAVALEEEGHLEAALEALGLAESIDGSFADLHYRMGRLLWKRGRFEGAKEHFEKARDLDGLRFRATDPINTAIREVASARDGEGVRLVDADLTFREAAVTPHAVPGEELFLEHVHMNFEGNYLLARTMFDALEKLLPDEIRSRRSGDAALPTKELCAERLAFTGWDRYRLAEILLEFTGQPPFTSQLDIEERQAIRARNRDALEERFTTGEALLDARDLYLAAMSRKPRDIHLKQNAAELYKEAKDFAGAAELYGFLRGYAPMEGSWAELEAEVLVEHGNRLTIEGRPTEALAVFMEAMELVPGYAQALYNIGVTLEGQGKKEEAIEKYREAVESEPSFVMARNNLAFALSQAGRFDDAENEYRLALAFEPSFAMAHGNLADLLVKLDRFDEAERHYHMALP
ncbi:MAG: tetratricopeptide repeat protein, partial [Planctomycetota bacterium]